MKNHIIAISLLLSSIPFITYAQGQYRGWHLGAQTGYLVYYGDLQTELLADNFTEEGLAWGLSLRKPIARKWNLRLQYNRGSFSANDRDQVRLARSLNVTTDLQQGSAMLLYYPFAIRRKSAALQPYAGLGLSYTYFVPYANLYNAEGQFYYYWADGSIRSQAESSPNPQDAVVLTQDNTYETRLDKLGNGFSNQALGLPASVGLDFRLMSRLNLSAEILAIYQFTDRLDGYDLGKLNDWLIMPTIGLSFRLGKTSSRQILVQPIYLPRQATALTNNQPVGYQSEKVEPVMGDRIPSLSEINVKPQSYTYYPPAVPQPTPNLTDTTVHIVLFPQLNPEEVKRASTLLPDSAITSIKANTGQRRPGPNLAAKVPVADSSTAQLKMQRLDSINTTGLANLTEQLNNLKANQKLLEETLQRQQLLDSVRSLQLLNKGDSAQESYRQSLQKAQEEKNQLLDSIRLIQKELIELNQQEVRLQQARIQRDTIIIRQEEAQYDPQARTDEQARLQKQLEKLERRIETLNNSESRRPTRYEQRRPQIIEQSTPVIIPYTTNAKSEKLDKEVDVNSRALDSVQLKLSRLQNEMDSLQQLAVVQVRPDTVRVETTVTQTDTLLAKPSVLASSAVYFKTGSTQPSAEGIEEITRFLAQLPNNEPYQIELQGYSDPSGQPAANQTLSLRRAESIRKRLIEAGIPESNIDVNYYGADPKLPRERWAYGRRVELVLKHLPK